MEDRFWSFPPTGGGRFDGPNDAGIENFKGSRIEHLGRETIQNSLDAASDDKTQVIVRFDLVKVRKQDFPGRKSLRKALESCLAGLEDEDDEMAKGLFSHAIKLLDGRSVTCLRVSDYQTQGLRYNWDKPRKGPFFAITKGNGLSRKDSETAGGAFGIGQTAPFASSDLRTVFYSTWYKEKEKTFELFQGKSILMSHTDDEDKETQGTGYYGVSAQSKPIDSDIPSKFRREEERQGTSIYVAGFNGGNDWKDRLVGSILVNFLYAIRSDRLVVRIDSDITISKGTLKRFFAEEEWVTRLRKTDLGEKYERVCEYHQALVAPSRKRDTQLNWLGHCRLWLTVAEDDKDYDRSVAIIRKTGMLITDELLLRFPNTRSFSAVFVCLDPQGNKILRSMEPPRHDKFEPDRLEDPTKKREGKKALKEMVNWIRNSINEETKQEYEKRTEMDEVSEFLPDPDPDREEELAGSETDTERELGGEPVIRLKPVRRPKPIVQAGDGDDSSGEETGSGGGGQGGGTGSSEGDGGSSGGGGQQGEGGGHDARKTFPLGDVRVVTSGGHSKTVYFTPADEGEISLEVHLVGDSSSEKLTVIESSLGTAKDGCVEELKVQADQRVKLELTFEEEHNGAIKAAAYAV